MTRPEDDNPRGPDGADHQARPSDQGAPGQEPQLDVEGRVIQPEPEQPEADPPADQAVPRGHEGDEADKWIRQNDRMAIGEREGDYSAWAEKNQAEQAQQGEAEEEASYQGEGQDQAGAPVEQPAGPGEAMDGVEAAGDDLGNRENQVEQTTEGQEPEYPYGEGYNGGEYEPMTYGSGEGGSGENYDQQYDYTGESGYTGEGSQGESTGESAGGSSGDPSAVAAQPPSAITTTKDEEDEDDDEEGGPKMTLGEHLEELRQRLIKALIGLSIAMVATIATAKVMITELLAYPYNQVQIARGHPEEKLMVIGATTGFTIFFKVALIAGAVLAAPWIFYQLWMFVAAGLYKHERRYVKMTVPFSAALFMIGAMFYLFVAAVPMMYFLFAFNDWMGIDTKLTLDSHISLMTTMMLVFGLAFQTPLVVLILYKVGILSPETLKHYRRHVIVVILIVAAILTPPDPTAQLMLAVPIYLLYELGMLLVYLAEKKRKRIEAAEGPKD